MDKVLNWLLARPSNAMLGLVLLYSLPYIGILGAAILVLVILAQGPQRALLVAGLAAAILCLAAVLTGGVGRVPSIIVSMLAAWSPAILLSIVTLSSRSMTLALQVSVLVVAGLMLAFFASVPDTSAFWTRVLETVGTFWAEQGVPEMRDVVNQMVPYVDYLTLMMALALWTVHGGVFALGCGLYNRAQPDKRVFGRFVDLNFGKVIAALVVIASLTAMLFQASWVESLAMFLYGAFWLQGLAVVHCLQARKRLPDVLLWVVYACLLVPLTSVPALVVLALTGYVDAWVDIRKRVPA